MIISIQATQLVLTREEILQAIPKETLEKIKRKNNHPFFQAYTIIQEGLSKPKSLNSSEQKPIYWIKEVVKKAADMVKKGLQFFAGHNKDNSTVNRKELGRVVGRLEKIIKGKLNQIVIGYFPDKSKIKDFDVCSIEADVIVGSINNDIDIAKSLKEIKGIALANSSVEKPAFTGAIRLASLQCFEGDSNINVLEKNKGDKKMTYEEYLNAPFDYLERALRDRKVFPSQVFSKEDIKKDHSFMEEFKRLDTLTKENEALKKELNDEKEARKKDDFENKKLNAKSRLETLLPENLTDKQRKFIGKKFNPDKLEDLSDEGLKKEIENLKNEYKDYAEVFGISTEDSVEEGSSSDKDKLTVGDNVSIEDSIVKDIVEGE